MASVGTNDLKSGMKVKIDNAPYGIVSCEFVKPGKGQAFARVKVKNYLTGRVLEKTFKSNEKLDLADVDEKSMRLLYTEQDSAVFMDDKTFDQIDVPFTSLGESQKWLMEDTVYDVILYEGRVIDVQAPTFMELVITETAPGVRGDTASGRVMKPAKVETGAEVQVPIFVNEGEKIKVDTRTGKYDSRVT
ncbi:MAG: elongation factor P [Candidatus Algichlamydia australiensis]|nr:elongation factor P [Chlamydiales bacterium]